MTNTNCPNCPSEDLEAYELETATAADGRSVVGCDYCIEDGRIVRGENAPVEQNNESADEECPHEFRMGTCIGCGANAADDFDELPYDPGPRKLSPSEVIGTDDLNLLSELVAEATESLERKARSDSSEASYHRHRIKVYRELLDRVCR